MISKEISIQKYEEYKNLYKRIPKYREYLEYSGLNKQSLIKIFGEDAYAKLQNECGDVANKLSLEKTPLDKIMRQFGDLVLEMGRIPSSSHWIHKDLKPGISGLSKAPHFIKWSEFPEKFMSWLILSKEHEYEKAKEIIGQSSGNFKLKKVGDSEFEKLIKVVSLWSPARRRNSEGEYKIELRKHLEASGFGLNEEFGESNFDLLINKRYAIEIKKDPNLSEYDRMFGQLARHLQHQLNIIALVMDAPSQDKFENFSSLVDMYLNKDEKNIEVIKK